MVELSQLLRCRYSGDTMPAINLIRLGIGTNLLIHEASYPSGEEDIASARGHSTLGQALLVGREYVSPPSAMSNQKKLKICL